MTRNVIAARLTSATPGPWKTISIPEKDSELATPSGELVDHVDLYAEHIAMQRLGPNTFRADMQDVSQENVACLVHVTENEPNVTFIRNAPEDMRWLLRQADALADQVEWLCTLCEISSDVHHAREVLAGYRGVSHAAPS